MTLISSCMLSKQLPTLSERVRHKPSSLQLSGDARQAFCSNHILLMPSSIPACINACSLLSAFLSEGCLCLIHAWLLLLLPCCVQQVPVVAITTTGGGTRSLTAMYGSLLGLQKLNLLDCISYIGGLSGTTW